MTEESHQITVDTICPACGIKNKNKKVWLRNTDKPKYEKTKKGRILKTTKMEQVGRQPEKEVDWTCDYCGEWNLTRKNGEHNFEELLAKDRLFDQ